MAVLSRFNWSAIVKDIQALASSLKSCKKLRHVFCELEKHSTWKLIGECGYCGGNIAYTVYAVWQNGAIISRSHNLDDVTCPHCRQEIGEHCVNHHSVHSHEA